MRGVDVTEYTRETSTDVRKENHGNSKIIVNPYSRKTPHNTWVGSLKIPNFFQYQNSTIVEKALLVTILTQQPWRKSEIGSIHLILDVIENYADRAGFQVKLLQKSFFLSRSNWKGIF